MSGDIVGFFRKDGRVIPIRSSGAGRAAGHALKIAKGASAIAHGTTAVVGAHALATHLRNVKASSSKVHVNRGLDALGLGLSIGTGALAAATFSGGIKTFAAGALATHAIDAAGITANAAAVAGHGHTKERVRLGARNEARNFVIGNAVYAAGILGIKKNRDVLVNVGKTAFKFGKKLVMAAE